MWFGMARRFWIVFAVALLFMADLGCRMGSISGTYVAHGPGSASLLQLTQTDGGQITGALDETDIRSDGRVHSDRTPITSGAVDGNQLTLTTYPGLLGTNIGGTLGWSTIRLQWVGPNGDFQSCEFHRSSASEFNYYADDLKLKANGIAFSATLLKNTQQLRGTAQASEKWIANAELHAQRIPRVKDYYRKIEEDMRALIERERATPNAVARGQISVAVSQKDVAGSQVDVDVNQTWDIEIGSSARRLLRAFADLPSKCLTSRELEKRGATPQAAATWGNACQQAVAERAKFGSAFKRIADQRAELKSFQSAAESHRRILVAESNRIE